MLTWWYSPAHLLGIRAQELLDVLNTQLENNHSTKLEWIVISLIVVEVSSAIKSCHTISTPQGSS